jgi:excisionase family DNA binding protein
MMTKLLTVKEVSEYLGLHPKTIYEYVERGFMPHRKLGSAIRFTEEDVRRYVDAGAR